MDWKSGLIALVIAVQMCSEKGIDHTGFDWVVEGHKEMTGLPSWANISAQLKSPLGPGIGQKAVADDLVLKDISSCCMDLHLPWLYPRLLCMNAYEESLWAK